MSVGGLIKPNTITNAYGCFCQFISRIKPAVENSIKVLSNYSPDSDKFQYHAVLIDIYSQIKEGSDNVDIFPFIHICNRYIKTENDLISLLSNILTHYDSCFQSDDNYIFFSSILSKISHKFQESYIFDFELSSKNLTDCIQEKYEIISTKSSILLFHPTNQCQFDFSFYLSMKLFKVSIFFSLFAFVISKRDDPSHYILYILSNSYYNSEWLAINDDNISLISYKQLKSLSHSNENVFVMFAFSDNVDDNVEFLCPQLTEIPIQELNSDEDIPISASSQSSQIQANSTSSEYSRLTSPSKSSMIESSSKTSSPNDKLELISNEFQFCKITMKLLSIQKMDFDEVLTEDGYFDSIKLLVNNYVQENGISQIYFTMQSEKHKKYHKHLRYDSEINAYMQKKDEPQILSSFLVKNKRITIKFVCREITIFNTTGTFHYDQYAEDLYDFCYTLITCILGIQINEIELFLYDKKIKRTNRTPLFDLFHHHKDYIISFSYTEK